MASSCVLKIVSALSAGAVFAAAASSAAQNTAEKGDTSRMANAVANEIEDIVAVPQWIAPMAKPEQPQQATQ
jgi:hypothetical protein